MPRRAPQPDTPEIVQARESGVIADENAPGGEWYVRRGELYRTDHPAYLREPEWFVGIGDLPTSPPFIPTAAYVANGA